MVKIQNPKSKIQNAMTSRLIAKIRSCFSQQKSLLAGGGNVLFASVVITTMLMGIRQLGMLESVELYGFDQLIRWRPDRGPDPRLLVVGITDADLANLGEYPISDRTMATLLEKLVSYQPRAIGLDVFRDIPAGEGRAALQKVFKHSDIVVVCETSGKDRVGTGPPPEIDENQVAFADLPVDRGGILRRSDLLITPPPASYSPEKHHLCNNPAKQLISFALELSRRYLKAEDIEEERAKGYQFKFGNTVFKRLDAKAGGYQNADVRVYQILIDYRSAANASQQVSFTDVLEGRVKEDWVRDRVILIGNVDASTKDAFYTPYSAGLRDNQKMPGVVVHAQIVSQILAAVLDGRPLIWYWPLWAEGLWIFAWSAAGGSLGWFVRNPWWFSLAAGVTVLGLVGICVGLFAIAAWVPLVPPAFAILGTAGSVVLVDRFNRSDYSKAVYKGVKGLLKIAIDIDEEQKEQSVAEITTTDYFQDLQRKAREIRKLSRTANQDDTIILPKKPEATAPSASASEPQDSAETESTASESATEQSLESESAKEKSTEAEEKSSDEDDFLDYFQQLAQRGKQLKNPDDTK